MGLWYGETNGLIVVAPRIVEFQDWFKLALALSTVVALIRFAINSLLQAIARTQQAVSATQQLNEQLQQEIADRERVTVELQQLNGQLQVGIADRERVEQELQNQLKTIQAQQQAIRELSTPVIPILEQIIVMPIVGTIDSVRARDITRSLLAGINSHRAKIVILDITGVPMVDVGVANHLNKAIQAARLKGAKTIVTGISDGVAETIVELGIDWGQTMTLRDLQTGLVMAINWLGFKLRQG